MTSEPRTILHLSSTSGPGGAEMIVKRLSTSLVNRRFRSVVCLFKRGWLEDACREAGIVPYHLPMHGALDVNWARAFVRLLSEERVAVVHAHEFTANAYGAFLGAMVRVPVVATVHGKNYYPDRLKRRAAYRFVSRTATMVAVSDDLREFIVQRCGIPEHRIRVIPNGVEIPLPPDAGIIEAARRGLGLAPSDRVIGAVGSLYPVKGHLYLIRALPEILRKYPTTRLLLVGQGELEGLLKEEADRLGIADHVRFLGFRKDVPILLRLMEVFVLPSLSEGMSMALLEAMAAERPIVATRVGGNSSLVEEGRTGYLVHPESPSMLADRIISILEEDGRAKEFGWQGRQRVEKHFSLAAMVDTYQECYSRLSERRLAS